MRSLHRRIRGPGELEPGDYNRVTLRFRDRELESAFLTYYFRHNLGNLRVACLGGTFLWVLWGLLLRGHLLAVADKSFDLAVRYGVFIPLLIVGLALSFTRAFQRIWEWVVTAIVVATILV